MDIYWAQYKTSISWTKYVHNKLKNNTHLDDKKIMELLMEDSKLEEDSCPMRSIKIGNNHQCDIPPLLE
jgi:hypothetical protein